MAGTGNDPPGLGGRTGYLGMDEGQAADARAIAGTPDEEHAG